MAPFVAWACGAYKSGWPRLLQCVWTMGLVVWLWLGLFLQPSSQHIFGHSFTAALSQLGDNFHFVNLSNPLVRITTVTRTMRRTVTLTQTVVPTCMTSRSGLSVCRRRRGASQQPRLHTIHPSPTHSIGFTAAPTTAFGLEELSGTPDETTTTSDTFQLEGSEVDDGTQKFPEGRLGLRLLTTVTTTLPFTRTVTRLSPQTLTVSIVGCVPTHLPMSASPCARVAPPPASHQSQHLLRGPTIAILGNGQPEETRPAAGITATVVWN